MSLNRGRVSDVAVSWSGDGIEALESRMLLAGGGPVAQEALGGGVRGQLSWFGSTVPVYQNQWIVSLKGEREYGAARLQANLALQNVGVEASRIVPFARGQYALITTERPVTEDMARRISKVSGQALAIAPNRVSSVGVVPNDPFFPDQYAHRNSGQPIYGIAGVNGADMGSTLAWDTSVGSESVVVAVIDTGTQRSHPDLTANIWRNPNEIPGNGKDDDGNGFIDDVNGWDFGMGDNNPDPSLLKGGVYQHGTWVAGTIGAVGNNNIGVAGLNWTVSILPVKIADDAFGGLSEAAIVAAHDYLTDLRKNRGINVVVSNNSYGGIAGDFYKDAPEGFVPEKDAIQRFVDTGATFVASAGNSALDNDSNFTSYPASYSIDQIIAVAATDNRDNLAGFSNFGLNTVDLGAPGVGIATTDPDVGYALVDGTSFSGPYVAAAASLLYAIKPNASQLEIKRALIEGVDQVPSLQNRTVAGGRLNVAKAIKVLRTEGPIVRRFDPGPVTPSIRAIGATFNKGVATTPTPTQVEVRRAGGDGTFGNANDTTISLTVGDIAFDASRTRLTLNLPVNLAPDDYRVTLFAAGFRDASGNQLNGNTATGQNETYQFKVVTTAGAFEPNDVITQATAAIFDGSGEAILNQATLGDGVNTGRDQDLYRIDVGGPGLITARVDAQALANGSTLDGFLRLFDARFQPLAANDNFNGLDPQIQYFVSTGGAYYVGVTGYANDRYDPQSASSGTATQSTGVYNLAIKFDADADEFRQFVSSDVPKAIPVSGQVTSTIEVTDGRDLSDVNVRVSLTHGFDSDLKLELVSPAGTAIVLAANRGGPGANYTGTIFDDEAGADIGAGSAPFTGSFRPDVRLNTLDGESALGVWRLRITDSVPLNQGTLVSWGLDLTLTNNISGPFEINDTVSTATATNITGSGSQTISASIGDGAFGLRDVDLYRLDAAAGTTLSARATVATNFQGGSGSSLDTIMRLFDAQGNQLLISNPDADSSSSVSLNVLTAGTYFVGVSGGGNANYASNSGGSGTPAPATGAYSLSLNVVGGISDNAVFLPGTTATLGLASTGAIGNPSAIGQLNAAAPGVGVTFNAIDFVMPPGGSGQFDSFFGATVNGFSFRNTANGAAFGLPVLIANESDPANRRVTMTGAFQGMAVRRTLSFGLNDPFVAVDVSLTNTTGLAIDDVGWMEAFNPQQGLNRRTIDPRTLNDVTGRMAAASWVDNDYRNGLTVGLAAPAGDTRAVASVVTPDTIRDPLQIVNAPVDPNGLNADDLLALAYSFGAIDSGASVSFRYFVLMGAATADVNAMYAAVNAGTGSGHLVVDPSAAGIPAASLPWVQYYPEGYSSQRVSEFIPIVNANSDDARVVVIARYERGSDAERDAVLFDGTVKANTRAGLTINTPETAAAVPSTSLVRLNEPYAIEIRSSRPVTATLSHYDFGISTGSAFSTQASKVWTISEGFKGAGVADFLVFYNTSATTAKVTTTIYPEGSSGPVTLTQQVGPFRRSGLSLAEVASIPDGPFGMKVESDQPIVAALSHFDSNIRGGFAILGVPSEGSTSGVSPEGSLGITSGQEFITILNAGAKEASVTLTFLFGNGSSFRVDVLAAAARRTGLNLGQVPGFPAGSQPYSVVFTASQPVALSLSTYGTSGGALGTRFSDVASTLWSFSEGFRPKGNTGVVGEYLRLFNPSAATVVVSITLDFGDGTEETFLRGVRARAAAQFDVHEFVSSARQGQDSFYGVRIKSPIPIVAYMAHLDANLGGGFGTLGVSLGNTAAAT
ncbi:MAG: S8 family serine peptidase [Phycisphaerae bacterium]|nr:S8 family serine peptidase [Phycisphaerae bacterium]